MIWSNPRLKVSQLLNYLDNLKDFNYSTDVNNSYELVDSKDHYGSKNLNYWKDLLEPKYFINSRNSNDTNNINDSNDHNE